MPPFSWFEAIFFGLCQLAVAAGMIFWSHYWRRRRLADMGGIFQIYRGRPLAEAFVSHLGHLSYFVLAWLFASLGFLLVLAGIVAYSLGSMEGVRHQVSWVLPTCIGLGLAFTVVGMSIKTKSPNPS